MPDVSDLNEDARPHAPKIAGATEGQRRQGRVLAMIHAIHLRDLARVRRLVDRIETDRTAAGELAETVSGLDMTRNLREFGSLCGRECSHLMFHHGAEEQQLFPALDARGDDGLRAVVAKLMEEHTVVHALLDELGERAGALMEAPDHGRYAALKETFDNLEAVVRSHFGYEETELEEAIGYHGLV